MLEFQSSKRPPAARQETLDDPGIRDSGRILWTVAARDIRFSLSTLPWVLLSRTILREFWRNDLKILEIFSDSMALSSSGRIMGLLSSMPVPGGVRWKKGEALSISLGMFGRVVPTTDLPILFLVSDIMERAILAVGEEVVAAVFVVLEELEAKKAVVVEETIRVAMTAALNANIFDWDFEI